MRMYNIKGAEDVIVAVFPYGEMFSKSIKVTKGVVTLIEVVEDDQGQFQIDAVVQTGQ